MAQKFARKWLAFFVISSVVLLAAIFVFFPATGAYDASSGHREAVILCSVLTIGVLAISVTGLLTNWRLGTILASIEVAQVVRLLAAMAAERAWPHGDDGPLIGWQGIVLPIMLLLVLLGAFSWYRYMNKIDEVVEG